MSEELDVHEIAGALRMSIGLLRRRLRQAHGQGELSVPESAALARLDRGGPATASALAKLEQISPQSMGVTLAGLEARGFVQRRADAADGRRIVLSITGSGLAVLRDRRNATTQRLASALDAGFTAAEQRQLRDIAPLLERLAETI